MKRHAGAHRRLPRFVDHARVGADAVADDGYATFLAKLDLFAQHIVEALSDFTPIWNVRDGEPTPQLTAFEVEVGERNRRGFDNLQRLFNGGAADTVSRISAD